MDTNYLSHLVHPIYKTPLQIEKDGTLLSSVGHAEKFVIREHVPILLVAAEQEVLTETQRHQDAGGKFHYKEHYQTDAETYEYFKDPESAVERVEHKRLHEYILSQIPKGNGWLLDTGCGGAWLAKAMKGAGKNVISMDIADVNPIRAVKESAYATHYGLVADVFELPFRENSIDTIVASEIIEHVSDPRRFIAALLQVLRPGGKLIITTPYNERIQSSLCIHCNKLTPHNAHLHSFTEKSIKMCVPASVRNAQTTVFSNKILIRLGIQRFLYFLPLPIWKIIDNLINTLTKKRAYRLMLVIEK